MIKPPHPFGSLKRGRYGAILVDVPLAFKTRSSKGEGRSPQHHYDCMTFDELAALPIADLAAPDRFLFSWIPLRSVFLTEPLMQAWGVDSAAPGSFGPSRTAKAPAIS
jgi:N6-adenosine-specific RNA methylase IME4